MLLRVVYVRTTLGATPSGTGVPDLRYAYPRQGVSRRSRMLRRILLKVERGVRRRVCRLRSCLHIPGADQSSASSIPCSMRFYYLMIQAINFIIHVLRSWIPHLEPIRAALGIPCSMRFYDWHGTDESIRISVVAELTCVLTPVLGFVHASCLWPCFHPTSQRKNPGPGTVNHSEVSTCARPVRTPKLFPLSSEERHQKET